MLSFTGVALLPMLGRLTLSTQPSSFEIVNASPVELLTTRVVQSFMLHCDLARFSAATITVFSECSAKLHLPPGDDSVNRFPSSPRSRNLGQSSSSVH